MSRSLSLFTGAVLGLAAATASAQHASFVLIGEPNPDAASAAPEHRFVHPVTSPYFHEDSFVTSDVRAWYVYHNFPDSVLGGEAHVVAAQLRLAITKDIQLVAYKDGYTFLDTDPIDEDGWNDVAAGIKWNFLKDFKNQFHASVGVGYEFPWGQSKVLQNDDEVRVWGSVNKGFGPFHFGGTANAFFAMDDDVNGDYMSWHVHADWYSCKWFSPVVEVNGYHFFNDADAPLGISLVDVTNSGGGDDVITLGIGGELRPFDAKPDLTLRAAWETPLTDETDVYGWRITASAVYSF